MCLHHVFLGNVLMGLGLFSFLGYVTTALISMGVHMSLPQSNFISLGICPVVELLGHFIILFIVS